MVSIYSGDWVGMGSPEMYWHYNSDMVHDRKKRD